MKSRLTACIILGFLVLFSCTKQIDDSILDVPVDELLLPGEEPIGGDESSQNAILAVESISLNGEEVENFTSEILQNDNFINVIIAVGSDVSNVSLDFQLSENATLKFSSTGLNFTGTGIQMFTVVAENGDERTYSLRINVGDVDPVPSPNEIISITAITDNTTNSSVALENTEIEFIANDIEVRLPFGTALSDLSFAFEITENSTLLDNGQNLNFENGQTNNISLENEDEVIRTYTLVVSVLDGTETGNEIIGITLSTGDAPNTVVLFDTDAPVFVDNTILIEVPFKTDVSAIDVVLELSEFAELSMETLTENLDFTNAQAKIFTVVPQSGTPRTYSIDVSVLPPTQREALIEMYTGPEGIDEEFQWDLSEGSDIGLWTGVTTNADGNVIRLSEFNDSSIFSLDENLQYLPFLEDILGSDGALNLPLELDFVLPNLMTISVDVGNESVIPEWIFNQLSITSLRFFETGLISVSDNISNLINLETLDFEDNRLTSIPESIAELPNLTRLDVGNGNESLIIPQAICDRDINDPNFTLTRDDTAICDGIEQSEAFITTWTGTTVTIPINDRFTYNYNIDWDNDGVADEFNITTAISNTYTTEGPHTIQITGEFPVISFANNQAIIDVVQWGTGEWQTMSGAFANSENVVITATDVPNFSNVTDMSLMFFGATSANPDVSNWDTSNVANMLSMFRDARSADPDVRNWNISNVTNMGAMFFGATSANPDVSNWDTSSLANMGSLFRGATSANPDVSNWDTSNAADMNFMFADSGITNPDFSNWNVANVTVMTNIFSGVSLSLEVYDQLLLDLTIKDRNTGISFNGGNSTYCNVAARNILINDGWTITDDGLDADCETTLSSENEITELTFIVEDGTTFEGIITGTTITAEVPLGIDISIVSIEALFSDGATSNIDSEDNYDFETEGETFIVFAEDGTEQAYTVSITRNLIIADGEAFITTWTGNEVVIPINPAFSYNYSVDWDNDGIIDETGITGEASFSYPTTGPHTIQIVGEFLAINFGVESSGDPLAIVGLEQWGTSEWLSMVSAFEDCVNLVINATDIPNFSSVTNMMGMFNGAELAQPDVSGWDVSSVTNMRQMFQNALLANPDISGWDVSMVANMLNMFAESNITDPDFSNWNIANVTTMENIFRGVTLSTEVYDQVLEDLSTKTRNNDVSFGGGDSMYCNETARQALEATGWIITDGGLDPKLSC